MTAYATVSSRYGKTNRALRGCKKVHFCFILANSVITKLIYGEYIRSKNRI